MSGAARLAAPVLSLAGELERPGPVDAGFAALHGLYWLSANLAQTSPLLLAVDDAHWADAASLRFLAYLAQRAEELPIALLVASRPPEPAARTEVLEALLSSPATALLAPRAAQRAGGGRADRGAPGPEPAAEFTRASTRRPAATRSSPASLIATLVEEAGRPERRRGGRARAPHPRDDRAIGPAAVGRLPATHTCAGERGRGARTRRRATRRRSPRRARGPVAAGAADTLAQQGILRPGRPLEFVHPIVRRAIADSLAHGSEPPRTRAPRACSPATGRRPSASPRTCSRRIRPATRWWSSSCGPRQRPRSRAAPPRPRWTTCVAPCGEPPPVEVRPHLLRELGGAERIVGDPAGARHLREALADDGRARRPGADRARVDPSAAPRGALRRGGRNAGAGDPQARHDDRELALELEAELATAGRLDPGTQPRTASRLERIGSGIDGGSPAERLVIASLGFQRALAGGAAGSAARTGGGALDRGLLAEQGPDSPALADAHTTLIMAERFDRVERALGQALEHARRRTSLSGIAVTSMFRSMLAQRRGEAIVAESEARTAVDAADEAAWIALELMARACVVEALIDRGQPAAAPRRTVGARHGRDPRQPDAQLPPARPRTGTDRERRPRSRHRRPGRTGTARASAGMEQPGQVRLALASRRGAHQARRRRAGARLASEELPAHATGAHRARSGSPCVPSGWL